jgi:hypothetical protein
MNFAELQSKILIALQSGPMDGPAVTAATGAGKSVVYKALTHLENSGQILVFPKRNGGGFMSLYCLPSDEPRATAMCGFKRVDGQG